MPKLLKRLLASSTKRFAPRPPEEEIDLLASPPPRSPTYQDQSEQDTELDRLAEQVIQRLRQKGINENNLGKQQLIDIIRSGGGGESGIDNADAEASQAEGPNRKSTKGKLKKVKDVMTGQAAPEHPALRRAGDDGQKVLEAITSSIGNLGLLISYAQLTSRCGRALTG
jgi:hypothetical protein